MAKRKPAKLAAAEGDTRQRGRRKLAARIAKTPEPATGLPHCPEHITGRARATYERWRLSLIQMGLDGECDAEMLEGAAVAYGKAVEADLQLAAEGIVLREVPIIRGELCPGAMRLKKHPANTVSATNWALVRSFCSEFGLSPAARARLSVTKTKQTHDDIKKLLAGPTLTDAERRALQ